MGMQTFSLLFQLNMLYVDCVMGGEVGVLT